MSEYLKSGVAKALKSRGIRYKPKDWLFQSLPHKTGLQGFTVTFLRMFADVRIPEFVASHLLQSK